MGGLAPRPSGRHALRNRPGGMDRCAGRRHVPAVRPILRPVGGKVVSDALPRTRPQTIV